MKNWMCAESLIEARWPSKGIDPSGRKDRAPLVSLSHGNAKAVRRWLSAHGLEELIVVLLHRRVRAKLRLIKGQRPALQGLPDLKISVEGTLTICELFLKFESPI